MSLSVRVLATATVLLISPAMELSSTEEIHNQLQIEALKQVKLLASFSQISESLGCFKDYLLANNQLRMKESSHLVKLNCMILELQEQMKSMRNGYSNVRYKMNQTSEENKKLNAELAENNKKIYDLQQRAQQLQEREAELTETVNALKKTVKVLMKKKEEVCPVSEEHEIRKQVQEFEKTKNWEQLRKSLEDTLNKSSAAYKQLQDIDYNLVWSIYQVGLKGYRDLIEVLSFCGGDVDMTDGNGSNFMHGAAIGGNVELARWLLEHGADIDAKNKYGYSVLLHAAEVGQLEMVKYLVRTGANTVTKDNYGRTALDSARNKGKNDVVEFLTQYPH